MPNAAAGSDRRPRDPTVRTILGMPATAADQGDDAAIAQALQAMEEQIPPPQRQSDSFDLSWGPCQEPVGDAREGRGGQPENDVAIAAALQAEEDRRTARTLASPAPGRRSWHAVSTATPAGGTSASGPDHLDCCALPCKRYACIILTVLALFLVGIIVYTVAYWYLYLSGHIRREFDLGDFQEISQEVFDGTNNYRASKGMSFVVWSDGIAEIAADHAGKMASGEAPFSHDGFPDRAARYPDHQRGVAGENLAYCHGIVHGVQEVVSCAVDGWIASPGHEKNMVGAWSWCGIGVARSQEGTYYISQLFGAP
eukprot:CAMPEP_0117544382 /NCGR_PEP_ID=MMETSP0784-20121206/45543_1 /TAXON_ID=39447 /ORGANISM="" /LENGTH=311 /DNA_ID=CAMNT_0005341181 /DNA_START=80 /DNA_END=1012 /DNA_ORIENTATION=-